MFDALENSKVIVTRLERKVSSCLVHKSSSRSGMILSNKALEVGAVQVDVVTSIEQNPAAEDPFCIGCCVFAVVKLYVYWTGTT